MTRATSIQKLVLISAKTTKYSHFLRSFLFGLLLPMGFSPFHLPGAAILGIALFYAQINQLKAQKSFFNGLFFGLGYFGLGISWVFISIHDYGHLNALVSGLITLFFTLYLALFPAFTAFLFAKLNTRLTPLYSCLLFSALWVLFEYFRSIFLGGFPWLILGFGQFDAPAKYLLPILGVFGVSFLTVFAATLLTTSIREAGKKRYLHLLAFITLLLMPTFLKYISWSEESKSKFSVGIIQANLSMRDKWDENLFWQLLEQYKKSTEELLGTQLIVMPESAIPLPSSYVGDFLTEIDNKAQESASAILLGIPQPTTIDENYYFNALIGLGTAEGNYQKQHLVPFGEYIPRPFQYISNRLAIPDANLKPGKKNQELVKIQGHPIATLICYELAYGDLLRHQLPQAEWIVSISDDGWFGHSLAMYQQQQIAQVRSLQTARYHVIANNDGLSAVINTRGEIINSLPAFQAGILKTTLSPATGITPWVYFGDLPSLLFCALFVIFCLVYRPIKTI